MKTTRKSIVVSALGLLLCAAMLIGTTYAWFSDSVTNQGNKIEAGTLDVALLNNSADISASVDPVFDYDLWEPGYSTGAVLAAKNNGTLALDYEILFQDVATTQGIENVLDVLVDGVKVGTLADFMDGEVLLNGSLTAGQTSVDKAVTVAMQTSAGNEYQAATAEFDILLRAKQSAVETDGFGSSDYDAGATYTTEATTTQP
ncbi:MAG: M73 family metallopeptidase [Oscillospiraceae bacterium]|jgi:predicted ribosomally synthesized peptide with SipW-like signal peptide|nr:M73 family metallopeptidase [Oscillospiraceae bacterium]